MPLDFPSNPTPWQVYEDYAWDPNTLVWSRFGKKAGVLTRAAIAESEKLDYLSPQTVSGINTFNGPTVFSGANVFNNTQIFNKDIVVTNNNIGQVYTYSKTLSLKTYSQVIFTANDNVLPVTGTYIYTAYSGDPGYGPLWNQTYTGIIQWFTSTTNDTVGSAAVNMHNFGHSREALDVYFKVVRKPAANPGTQSFEVWSSYDTSSSYNWTFKFRRIG